MRKSVLFRSADAYIRELSEKPSDVRADVGIRAPILPLLQQPLFSLGAGNRFTSARKRQPMKTQNKRKVMNEKFDELAQDQAQSVTRRRAMKKSGIGLAGIVLASLGLANKAEARDE